jgi:hypothetical protein
VQLREDAPDHRLDHRLGQVELVSDRPVVEPLAQQAKRLVLQLGQPRQQAEADLVDAEPRQELLGHEAVPLKPEVDQLVDPVGVDVLEHPGIGEGEDVGGVQQFPAAQDDDDPAPAGKPQVGHRLVLSERRELLDADEDGVGGQAALVQLADVPEDGDPMPVGRVQRANQPRGHVLVVEHQAHMHRRHGFPPCAFVLGRSVLLRVHGSWLYREGVVVPSS